MELLSRDKTRYGFSSQKLLGTGWISEAFWDLGINRKVIRQIEMLRLLHRFHAMRQAFYEDFWSGFAEQTGAEIRQTGRFFEINRDGHSMTTKGTRILQATNLTGKYLNGKMAPSLDWRQAHPIYSPDSRSVVHLLFLRGKMLTAIRSTRPFVKGDGYSSIYSLMRYENQHRLTSRGWFGLQPLMADINTQIFLLINNHSLEDVPALGQKIEVKFGAEESNRFNNTTVTPHIMEDLHAACADLVDESHAGFLSVTLACDTENGPVRREDCSLINVSEQPDLAPYLFTSLPQDTAQTMDALIAEWLHKPPRF